MDGLSSVQSLEALSKMLSQGRDDEDYEQPVSSTAGLGPGHIGPAKCETNVPPVVSKNSKDIWSEEEVPEGSELDDTWDTRQQPEYEILFKQKITTEDVFLGMSRKDPSSACCECMLIKIKLPDTKIADVFLDVKEKFLDLRSPKFKLGLHLPHPVSSQRHRPWRSL